MSAQTGSGAIRIWRAYGTIRAFSRCWTRWPTGESKGPMLVPRIADFRQAGLKMAIGRPIKDNLEKLAVDSINGGRPGFRFGLCGGSCLTPQRLRPFLV